MTEFEMKEKLYGLYQLDWMLCNGCSIKDIIKGMLTDKMDHEFYIHKDKDGHFVDIEEMYSEWERDVGFNGSIWACFDEFCENELIDVVYIKNLLNYVTPLEGASIRNAYMKWLAAEIRRDKLLTPITDDD